MLVTQPDQLQKRVNLAIKQGFQANIHAIGDRGNRLALNAFERAYKTVGGKTLRHSIEHAQVIAPVDIPRFKSLHIVASMQPTHATSDMNMAADRLGEERLAGAYAWRKLLLLAIDTYRYGTLRVRMGGRPS